MVEQADNDLFFVGDGHQRIYSRNKAAMSKCGIDIRGRSRKLYLNYRTTDEIRRQAVALLEGCQVDDLDDGHDETRRYKSLSHGPKPEVVRHDSMDDVFNSILKKIQNWNDQLVDQSSETVCVIAPSRQHRDQIGQFLKRNGQSIQVIDEAHNAGDDKGVVHIATMHRAKGLEFDRVIVVSPRTYLDDVRETEHQRKLLYVAISRAKRDASLLIY
jgi:DNA helicase IV